MAKENQSIKWREYYKIIETSQTQRRKVIAVGRCLQRELKQQKDVKLIKRKNKWKSFFVSMMMLIKSCTDWRGRWKAFNECKVINQSHYPDTDNYIINVKSHKDIFGTMFISPWLATHKYIEQGELQDAHLYK